VCIEKSIPVAEVAAMFGVTRATIYNWMTGKTTPSPRYLALISKITPRLSKRK
jgi:predicted DNA-binding transcriptional regulator AlpA